MTQVCIPIDFCLGSSSKIFDKKKKVAVFSDIPLPLGALFNTEVNILPTVEVLTPLYITIDIGKQSFVVLTSPQPDGTFVARTQTDSFNANGQGTTVEEALQDIKEAIKLLIEEDENPSGDVPWPKNFQ